MSLCGSLWLFVTPWTVAYEAPLSMGFSRQISSRSSKSATGQNPGEKFHYICESYVAQSCPTLCDPVACSPPGSSVPGILQARILEWVAYSFSRGSSWPGDRTQVSRITGRRFNLGATREALLHLWISEKDNRAPASKMLLCDRHMIIVIGIPIREGRKWNRHRKEFLVLMSFRIWPSRIPWWLRWQMQETWVWSLGWEDLLEEGMATHSSVLAWRIPWTEEPAGLQSMGSQRAGHNWATKHSTQG